MTWFDVCEQEGISCQNKKCRHWLLTSENNNCTLIAAKKGPMTLHDIGQLIGVSRMRVCQIEKKIVNKICNMIMAN